MENTKYFHLKNYISISRLKKIAVLILALLLVSNVTATWFTRADESHPPRQTTPNPARLLASSLQKNYTLLSEDPNEFLSRNLTPYRGKIIHAPFTILVDEEILIPLISPASSSQSATLRPAAPTKASLLAPSPSSQTISPNAIFLLLLISFLFTFILLIPLFHCFHPSSSLGSMRTRHPHKSSPHFTIHHIR